MLIESSLAPQAVLPWQRPRSPIRSDDPRVALCRRESALPAPCGPGTIVVTIAHLCDLVQTGLAATLGSVPEFEVRVWRESEPGPGLSVPRPSSHILVGDLESISKVFAEALECGIDLRFDETRVVLIGQEDRRCTSTAAPRRRQTLCLALDCGAHELIAAVHRLCSRVAPTVPASAVCVARGGLAPGALRRVREHIQNHLYKRIELAELAAIAGLSECHFARAFKQSMGMPPHRYVLQRRIEVAALLIERTDQPLSEIALEVGFSDQSHFTRMFSRLTRQTPRAFRHQCR